MEQTETTENPGNEPAAVCGLPDSGFLEQPVRSHAKKQNSRKNRSVRTEGTISQRNGASGIFMLPDDKRSIPDDCQQLTDRNAGTSCAYGKLFPFIEKTALRHLMAAAVITGGPKQPHQSVFYFVGTGFLFYACNTNHDLSLWHLEPISA